ncbi:MAG TPA: N-acetylmuramoyl-L-alanine amidase [Terriglobales bacterium]|nr:N-acetylmuramoyl-L-alanine amidase [Terriglobales bacterium]
MPRGVLTVACLFVAATCAQARVHRSQAWAEQQFNKAEAQRQTLEGHAEQARTRREYQAAIASYRRIVLEAPTTSKADGSAFLVAQLTAEMGRHFKDDMVLYSAIREYKYLRREYPGSKHRVEALLAIAEIYKNDLGDNDNARATFEEFLRRYQHSDLVKEAGAELADVKADSAADDSTEANENDANSSDHDGPRKEAASNASDSGAKAAEKAFTENKSTDKIVRVTSVEHKSTEDYTRITINLEQDVEFNSQRIAHPERIFFDLKNARVGSRLNGSSEDIDDGRVKKIRIAQYKPGRARIVVETDGRQSYNASLVLNPPRLIIEVHNNDVHASAACATDDCDPGAQEKTAGNRSPISASEKSSSSGSPSTPKKVIVEADADLTNNDPPSDSDDAAPVSRPVARTPVSRKSRKKTQTAAVPVREAEPTSDGERSLIRTLGLKIGKIVIDPGHGGHDTGTIGPHGLLEKDLVLDVSKRLGKLLQTRLGADIVFTRRDDTFIPLETRTAIANQEQADLFVSVHANSSHDPDARGVETYYLNFTSSPEALEVAARENAASDKSIHELQDLVKKIALKEKIEESREFASDVQQSLHTGLAAKNPGERDRGVKKAPFVVLIGANMPSILAEISFLSNPGDEHRLRTPEYRQRIAESLYRGISRYINGLGGLKVASKMEKSSAE